MMQRLTLLLLPLLTLAAAGCDRRTDTVTERHEPVVVYAHGDEETSNLAELFAGFTRETGIPVTIRFDDSARITDNVIGNTGSPPADVLLTSNVADVWRAADRGALRPIKAAFLENIPEYAKDPDNLWVAHEPYLAEIGHTAQNGDGGVQHYADLAAPEFKGHLCLSSSELPINRAVIALLIADLGEKQAERIVRGWVRNLSLPPYDSEDKLIAALQSGVCDYGVFSDVLEAEGVARLGPGPPFFNVEGLGVARHARYPESAQLLTGWLLQRQSRPLPDFDGNNIAAVGWRDEEAALLAERAGYR